MRWKKTALPKSNSWLPRHEDVGRNHIGETDDVGAAIESRHQRGRQGIARMGEHDVAALGALGLHHRGQLGKAAAALAVGHDLRAHRVRYR
jgi:hypothetical protein